MSKRNRQIVKDGGAEAAAPPEPKRMKVDGSSYTAGLTHDKYTRHADLLKPLNDPNTYTLGAIRNHNVVIACLPKGKTGTIPAATVAARMVSTFPSIKFGLMVGIGGGVPPKVRLGDVVVSTPVSEFPGVGDNFERTRALDTPPNLLLTALTKLESEHDLTGSSKIPEFLEEMKQKWPGLAPKYLRPESLEDILFKADYDHFHESIADGEATADIDDGEEKKESCQFCDRTKLVKRKPRNMRIHYGLIASGNKVMKNASFRDKLNKDLGGNVLCIEMEAAGLMNNFPCIAVRGICDYANSHKNQDWQEHAATIAAAFAKELLGFVQPSDIDRERPTTNPRILGRYLA
ncbi:nucleoside phosphorylase domain-containing protein [Lasiosphaeria miniovina]|uniref:Nucleoside phosphorylase domain-containing protein n=1 Tax=Lasiosphaeria miniovina TaxID=1954250 RepID=A0AA40BHD5_9PEZI|nr:nucleoside phosphorylase domain-containing protein [Lasiosphaeria miniovina]KAK0734267.1 nucleoside phosphorylase domain-containing protein [Lasiosphaeria miniovina]